MLRHAMRHTILGALALAAVSFAGASPALAKPGDTACVWNHLSDGWKNDAYADYQRDSNFSGDKALLARLDDEGAAAAKACGVTINETLGNALGGYAMRELSARSLQAKTGVTGAQVARSSAKLPAADRARSDQLFVAMSMGGESGPGHDDDLTYLRGIATTVAKDLKLGDEGMGDLIVWLISDAVVRAYDK